MENIQLFFTSLVYLNAILFSGWYLSKRIGMAYQNWAEALAFNFALGSLVYAYLFIFLGMAHALYAPILVVLLLIPLPLSGFQFLLVDWRLKWQQFQARRQKEKSGFKEWMIVAIILCFAFFPVLPHLLQFPGSWDSLAYHLMLPKVYLHDHTFSFYEWFPQTAFPIGFESLFGYTEALGQNRMSNLIAFGFIVVTIIYMNSGLRYLFDKKVLWFSILLFVFRPLLYSEVAITPYIDFPFALFGLLISVSLYKFWEKRSPATFMLLMLLTSYVLILKYTGLFILSSVFIVLIGVLLLNRKASLKFVKQLLTKPIRILGVLMAFIPSTFWYLRNIYYFHNPVYPFLNAKFHGLDYDPVTNISMSQSIKEVNSFVVNSLKTFGTMTDTAQDYINLFEVLSCATLLLCAVYGLLFGKGKIRIFSAVGLLLLIPVIVMVGPLARYQLPVIPTLVIVASSIFFERFDAAQKKIKLLRIPQLILGVLVLVVAFMQIDSTFVQRELFFHGVPKRVWIQMFTPEIAHQRLTTQDNYPMIEYANTHLDKNHDKILFVFDNRLYYFDIPVEFCFPSIVGIFTNPNIKTADEAWQKLKDQGFTYVAISTNWGTYPYMRNDIYVPFVKNYLSSVFSSSGVTLYKMK